MPLVFRELHPSSAPELLNEEWLLLENTGPNVVNAQGCTLTVARRPNDRPRPLGTLEPGFILKPHEKIRLVTGTPSKKAQGAPPAADELRNYHLFLREPVLTAAGQVVRLSIKQQELVRAVFAPQDKDGIEAA